jgi:TP901 family phage tail tape measure protein
VRVANYTVSTRLIADVGQYVGGMNTAATATARLGESAALSTTRARSGFDIAGKGALLMGAAVVGGVGIAISKSMEFEKAMSAVGAATQATTSTMGQLRAAAMKAGADTQYSATEAANAITEMAKAGVSAKDIMDGGLTGALALAAAGQIDVAEAAGIASTAMTQFGLSGNQLPHVADLLAAGAGKAMGSVDDLGQALNQAGLIASSTGISIEETTGTLAAFASAGLLGSDAGTSFKTMLQKLQAPSKEAAGIMADLGINAYNASGSFVGMQNLAGQLQNKLGGLTQAQRDNALATIFGSDAVRAANVLYTQGSEGISQWTAKVNDSGFAQRQAAAMTDNLAGDLERLGGAFDTLMINLGSGAQGPLRDVVQLLTHLVDGVGWAVDAFGSLPGPVQTALAAMVGIKLLSGPLSSGFKYMTDAVLGWSLANDRAAISSGGLRNSLANLIGMINPVTLGVGLAAAAFSQYAAEAAAVDAKLSSATDAGDSFRSTLADQNGELNKTSLSAADLAVKSLGLADAFDRAGISSREVARGLTGDKQAYDDMLAAAKALDDQAAISATQGFWGPTLGLSMAAVSGKLTENTDAVEALRGKLQVGTVDAGGWGKAVKAAGDAAAASAAQTQQAAEAQQQWLESLQQIAAGFVDPVAAYKGLLADKQQAEQQAAEATAAATSNSKDSWRDYVQDVEVSLGELATKLEEQITAQANWRDNIAKIALWAGTDVANYLAQMGQDGVQIVAQMADGTTADAQRMAADIQTVVANGGDEWIATMDNKTKVMGAIAAMGASATVQGIAAQLGLGVGVVAGIVGQYNATLANGVNPLLSALGKPTISGYHVAGINGPGGTQVKNAWSGGYMGDGGMYEPKGIVHGGEFVLTKKQTAKAGVGNLYAYANALDGYAGGGFVSSSSVPRPLSTAPYTWAIGQPGDATMAKGYDETKAWVDANAMGPGPTGPIGAGVQRWRALVLAALNLVHQPGSYADITLRRMNQESGGNPRAINLTDSNAKRGTPSKGLMQVIDPTFRAYAMAGHNTDIWDPMSNVLASMRYALGRYGSLPAAYNKSGGYAAGGTTPAGDPFWVGEQGPELMWSSRQKYVSSAARSREVSGGFGGGGGGAGGVTVSITGAQIVGTLDLGEGITARIDGRIVKALTGVADRGQYNG